MPLVAMPYLDARPFIRTFLGRSKVRRLCRRPPRRERAVAHARASSAVAADNCFVGRTPRTLEALGLVARSRPRCTKCLRRAGRGPACWTRRRHAVSAGQCRAYAGERHGDFRGHFRCHRARASYIIVQFFIVREDALGRDVQGSVDSESAAGVRSILYDSIGSFDLPHRYVASLRAGGVDTHPFAP